MQKLTRREALRYTAMIGAGCFVSGSPKSTRADSPQDKLNIACIGVGGRGSANVNGVDSQNLIAFADVDEQRAGKTFEKYSQVPRYTDYRSMLDKHASELDAVVISTPDHMHFHPAYEAMQRDLHVYLEKPLGHNVWETRMLTDLARKKNLATQLGVQRHTIGNMHRVVELIQSGAIGEVSEVYSWKGGNRGMPNVPQEQPAIPSHLDYDLWVGPADYRPYHPSFCPYGWRFWWDYGTGETGNFGCHILDIPFWALNLKYPTRVDASGPEVDPERTPKSMDVTYRFPALEKRSAVTLHWSHGEPDVLKEKSLSSKGNNTLFIGSEGMLLCGFGQHQLLPEDKFVDFEYPEEFIPDSPGFHREWLLACRGQKPATCNFDYSGPLTETVLLGNVAYRAGGFSWDAEQLAAVDNQAAAPYIKETYRKGWEINS